MKKMSIFILLATIFLSLSCESRQFQFVGTLKKSALFKIDQAGPFNKTYTFTGQEFRDAFEIPDDAVMREVKIEKLYIIVDPSPDNPTTALSLSGYIRDQGQQVYMFADYPAPLTAVNSILGINTLIAGGVAKLKQKINNYLGQIDDADLEIHVEGDSTPIGGQTVKVWLYFTIEAAVIYDFCMDAFPIMGKKCEL